MARLPSDVDLGGLPSSNSGRGVATYDAGGISRGMASAAASQAKAGAAIASGVSDLGKGLGAAGEELNRINIADEAFNYTKAKAAFLTNKINRDSELQTDQDIGTMQQRYDADIAKYRDESLGMVSNPRLREKLSVELSDDVARGQAHVKGFAFKKAADSEIASAQDQLRQWSEAALTSGDEKEKSKLVSAGLDRIAGLQAKGYISAQQEQELRRGWVEDYGKKWLASRPPEERVKLTAPALPGADAVVDRIIGVESGGKANARNPNSSAAGLGQFIDNTWLGLIREAHPELARRSDAELIALKSDPALSREMTKLYAQKNSAYLQGQGIDASPQAVYLAHFLGPGTAAKVLKADPNTPISDLVGKDAIEANASVLSGKTAGSVVQWAGNKMAGGKTGTPADFVPFSERMQIHNAAQREVLQAVASASSNRGETIERQILDASAGIGTLPSREIIQADPLLSEPKRNELLRAYDSAAGDVATLQRVTQKYLDPNAGPFNPYDKTERDAVDKLYKMQGGNMPALQAVVERTGIVPKGAVAEMRGSLVSNDPKRVAGTANVAANLLTKNPTIFSGVDGGSELEDAGVKFQHYTERFGMTAEEAGKKIIEENSPEYKQKIAKIKPEDIKAIVEKKVSIDDLRGAFDTSWWPGSPQVEFTPEARQGAYSDYIELFREKYAETGDVDLSKKLAANQMKKVWGVSKVNGSEVVMRFPPDRAPAMANIDDPAGRIAVQAIGAIKETTGQDVPRDKIMLSPLPGGQTSRPYAAGEPPPYLLSWFDKNGVLQTLNPGKAFVADPKAMRDQVSAGRKAKFDVARQAADLVDQDLARAPFGVGP